MLAQQCLIELVPQMAMAPEWERAVAQGLLPQVREEVACSARNAAQGWTALTAIKNKPHPIVIPRAVKRASAFFSLRAGSRDLVVRDDGLFEINFTSHFHEFSLPPPPFQHSGSRQTNKLFPYNPSRQKAPCLRLFPLPGFPSGLAAARRTPR